MRLSEISQNKAAYFEEEGHLILAKINQITLIIWIYDEWNTSKKCPSTGQGYLHCIPVLRHALRGLNNRWVVWFAISTCPTSVKLANLPQSFNFYMKQKELQDLECRWYSVWFQSDSILTGFVPLPLIFNPKLLENWSEFSVVMATREKGIFILLNGNIVVKIFIIG